MNLSELKEGMLLLLTVPKMVNGYPPEGTFRDMDGGVVQVDKLDQGYFYCHVVSDTAWEAGWKCTMPFKMLDFFSPYEGSPAPLAASPAPVSPVSTGVRKIVFEEESECSCHQGSICSTACEKGLHHEGCGKK